jgi:hypothetical protein
MVKKFVGVLAGMAIIGCAATLFAQESGKPAKAAEATLKLEKKSYTLTHALAYETTIDSEDAIVVVLSGQPVSGEELKEAKETEKGGNDPNLKRPFLRLVFKKTGELKYWSAAGGGTMLGRRNSNAAGEVKLQNGRVSGKASEPPDTGGMFLTAFDARFDVALLKAGESLPASTAKKGGPAANVKPSVTGVFKGNGKDAKLAYVSAHWREPFSDKPSMVLVFTEKDHSKDKKPDFNAGFGKFGSALIVSLHEDGSIFGCEIAHTALKHQNFSSIGNIEATGFTYEDGKVEGELATGGPVDTFGDTWEVKLKFLAPLGEIPKEFQPAAAKEPEKKPTDKAAVSDAAAELSEKPAGKSAEDQPKAKDLALTKDASDVEYMAIVEQLRFKSKANVKSVCAELTASLKAQGWTKDGSDLITPASAILKRKRGDAELTIFVKPEGGGSEVKVMTDGLAWD